MTVKTDRKKPLVLTLKVAISLCFIWFVFHKIDFIVVKGYLLGADFQELLYAFGALTIGGFCGALSWRFVLLSKGYQLPFLKIAAMYWSGMFFNSFLPSNVGGDFYKGYLLINHGGGVSKAAVTILLDRIINFAVLLLIGALAFCALHGRTGVAVVALAFFLIAMIALRSVALKSGLHEGSKLGNFAISSLAFFGDGRNCALTFAAALFSQGLKIGCHVFLIRAMGLDLDVNCVWYIIPLFGAISVLPISLGGIGIREYVAIAIAAPLDMAQEELVALSLVSHLLFVCVNCLGFIPIISRQHDTPFLSDK